MDTRHEPKKQSSDKQNSKNNPTKDSVVLGEATELTKGYNFDRILEIQTWDKVYNNGF